MMDTATTPTTCACGCGRPRSTKHRGWSSACYFRWYKAGKPADGSLTPAAECAHHGCTAAATRRRWCEDHQDVRRLYLEARAAGIGRASAAARVGVRVTSTYAWEPGDDTRGRPRKQEGEAHREDYWFLRDNGVPVKEAAVRAGITVQTARKWERCPREGAAA